MGALDKLKENVEVELPKANNNIDNVSVSMPNTGGAFLDATNPNAPDRVDMVSMVKPQPKHSVVLPKNKQGYEKEPESQMAREALANSYSQAPTSNTATRTPAPRKTLSIDMIAQEDEPDPGLVEGHPHDQIMASIDPDDPNSIFRKYADEKQKEMEEWIAERAEKKAMEQLEADEEDDEESSYSSPTVKYEEDDIPELEGEDDYDMDDEEDSVQYQFDDDLDIPDDDDEDEEEDEELMDDKELEVTEDVDVSEEVDDVENDTIDDENVDSAAEEDTEAAEEVVEAPKEEVKKKKEEKVYKAKDVDVQVIVAPGSLASKIEEDEEEDDDDVDEEEEEALLQKLKEMATEKLKPASKRLDLSSFTVAKKATTSIAPIFKANTVRVGKWVLPESKSCIRMKEFSGVELEALRRYSEDDSYAGQIARFTLIYDHIDGPKPATFQEWAKTTSINDINHYFFAIYVACFKDANYLPRDCEDKKCNESFLSENIDIMDMVEFKDKESRKNFTKIYKSDVTNNTKGMYISEIVPVSDTVAVSFKEATLWDIIQVSSLLSPSIREKFSTIINYIPYIDELYYIDTQNQQLVPIDYKRYPENSAKDLRSKLNRYNNIFNTMKTDEFGVIGGFIADISDPKAGMSYVIPELTCPKCGKKIEKQPISGEQLVFIRNQLATLTSTSLS